MDKKQAVLKSYVMWAWLAQSGKEKCDYPLYEELKYYDDVAVCPLCTYDDFKKPDRGGVCHNCPMYGKWETLYSYIGQRCHDSKGTGIWESWTCANSIDHKKLCAGIIARSLWKRYKELGG
jgi:hypothetical protein